MPRWGKGILLGLCAITFGALMSALLYKQAHGLFNALDAAIFNQVFWQSLQGNLYQMTIHPQSYLGDHFNLFILLLLPLYALYPHPETLFFLQVLAIVAAPLPLLFLHRSSSKEPLGVVLLIVVCAAWWMNPFVHNATLFEFHPLLFAAPLLTLTYTAYRIQRFGLYLTGAILLFLLREDLPLTVFMFSLLALFERRSWKWWLPIGIASPTWFLGATHLSAHLNPSGGYKFFELYGWMGDTLKDFLLFPLRRPWAFFLHIAKPLTTKPFVLFFGAFAWMPTLAPKALLLGLPSFAMQALTTNGLNTTFLITHYQIILQASCLIAAADAVPTIVSWIKKTPAWGRVACFILGSILVLAQLGTVVGYSPLLRRLPNTSTALHPTAHAKETRSSFLQAVSTEAHILSGTDTLLDLSDRPLLMTFHYAYIGNLQFSTEPFPLPKIDAALFDSTEALRLLAVKDAYDWIREGVAKGPDRLRAYFEAQNLHPDRIGETWILFTHDGTIEPYTQTPYTTNEPKILSAVVDSCEEDWCFSAITAHPANGQNIYLRLSLLNAENHPAWEQLLLPAYGLYTPESCEESCAISTLWKPGWSNLNPGAYRIHVTMEPLKGAAVLGTLRDVVFQPQQDQIVLDTRTLGTLTVTPTTSSFEAEELGGETLDLSEESGRD